jgi:hypothetical protein
MRWYALGAVAAGVVLALAFGPSYLGYDSAWALVWGADVAGGNLPNYEADFAPTPHPLANLVAVPLSLLGDGGGSALGWLTFAGFGALVAGAWALGAEIGGIAGGALAALLVATRSDLGREAAFGSVDLPFLALVVWALFAAVRRGPGSALPLALLIPAGLLRPEAWGLSLAAWLWAAVAREERLGRLLGLAVAAPVLWLACDLVVTGDPLHSLHGTRDLAAALERPRGIGTAFTTLDDGLRDLIGTLPLLAGIAGAAVAIVLRRPAAVAAGAVVVLGVAGYVVLGAAGLPVLFRYLLAPATLLLVLAGGGIGAAIGVHRPAGWAAAAGIAVLLAASVPATARDLSRARDFTHLRADVHDDLRAVTSSADFQSAADACERILVPGFRVRPFVLLDTGRDAEVGNLPDGRNGLLLTYADDVSEIVFNLGARGEVGRQAAPVGAQRIAANLSWEAYRVC